LESKGIKYTFQASPWQYRPPGGWYFVTLPFDISKEIREHLKWQEEGWGRLKAKAQIGNVEWDTAIWFDSKQNAYLLPLKAAVRNKLNIEIGKNIMVNIWL
jgi:hypothetical protein